MEHAPVMMTKHLMLPYQVLPDANHLPKPCNAEAGHYDEEDLPYISTVTEVVHSLPEGGETTPRLTPNFFEILLQNDCLPSDKKCSDCLRDKKGANCQKCASVCPCYCKTLCHIQVEEKFITKSLTVRPPLYARDPSRLIPRIIHQTWFEDVTPEKYPNMSRLIESFKQSGWEYKFYTDDESVNFLSTHFPPEVRQAYDALRPGAFKADLFRYCVLLIHGGVYADMDIMLETNLDLAVANDVGFMVPQDEPGTPVNHRMCLWNGFIAAAPGHPFLAKVIETVVNNVRNRFTSVDVDHLFCPDPELSILHAFDTLFTAGPCILGAMVNKVLGRHGQTPFESGEMDIWESSKKAAAEKGTDFIIGPDDRPSSRIPGKTIILHQNKWDVRGIYKNVYSAIYVQSKTVNRRLLTLVFFRLCRWELIALLYWIAIWWWPPRTCPMPMIVPTKRSHPSIIRKLMSRLAFMDWTSCTRTMSRQTKKYDFMSMHNGNCLPFHRDESSARRKWSIR
jgi:hypothetical protein